MKAPHLLFWMATLLAGCRHAFPLDAAASGKAAKCAEEIGGGCFAPGNGSEEMKGILRLLNVSKVDVCHVHLRPSHLEDWTSDSVDEELILGPNTGMDFKVHPGEWDVMLSDCKGKWLLVRNRVAVVDAGAIVTLK